MAYTVWPTGSVGSAANEALVKESVGDLISNLFPLETPLQATLGKTPMNNVETYQPIDTFSSSLINRVSSVFGSSGATSLTTSAQAEGSSPTDYTAQYPAKLKSIAEIQLKSFTVSGTDRAMSMYGIADRYAYEALKVTQALANMFEHSFWWSPGTATAGADLDSAVGTAYYARQTQGLVHWICKSGLQRSKIGLAQASFTDAHGNEFGTNSPALNTGASAWAYDAGGISLDKNMFKEQLMAQWYAITGRQGGAVGFTGGRIKNMFSEFALTANGAINDRTLDAASKLIVDTVDYYETDYGVVSLNLCRYLNIASQSVAIGYGPSSATTTIPYDEVLLFIQPRYFKIGVVRPIHLEALAKTGDFERGQVVGEMGLVCTNPQAGSAIVNCVP